MMERMYEREAINHGREEDRKHKGYIKPSAVVVIAGKDANEDAGDCYGISFLYSGSFNCEVEKDQQIRLDSIWVFRMRCLSMCSILRASLWHLR